jgi:tetratricopeptide (TPR) repeat protein
LRSHPEDPNIWNRRGLILQKLERDNQAKTSFEQAITNCDRILKRKPDDADIWFQKALALTLIHKYDGAITAYNQTVTIKPDFSNAWYNMACCYAQQNDLERAIQSLQQAIDLNSHCQEEAKTDSDFDPIREYPRFQTLVAKDL